MGCNFLKGAFHSAAALLYQRKHQSLEVLRYALLHRWHDQGSNCYWLFPFAHVCVCNLCLKNVHQFPLNFAQLPQNIADICRMLSSVITTSKIDAEFANCQKIDINLQIHYTNCHFCLQHCPFWHCRIHYICFHSDWFMFKIETLRF